MNEEVVGAVRDLLLLLVGGGLTIFGGYLADKREDERQSARAATDTAARLRERQLEAVVEVIAAAVPFVRSAGAVGVAIMANARAMIEFANTAVVEAHGPISKELDRAVALACLMFVQETSTSLALKGVEAASKAFSVAWGNALGSDSTRQPLEIELAGPIVSAEAAFKQALDRLTATASAELVTKE